ncbi:PEGA domain-containing protein [Myxococcus sp. RHSTA-1-4]|uniref:PEGA domain-containing protein n=1 Tax=Myxococcus sp. RHSTA-1-4 TaxID=2874601 RepID=UPI001CBB8DBB|nr:PEGA domain-containing protein [Myxococcus sp. RHSTA-1-4]MBZ4421685.1 PEGA domain-containing protein [Myxococcus sp. RHSTA-1-4]
MTFNLMFRPKRLALVLLLAMAAGSASAAAPARKTPSRTQPQPQLEEAQRRYERGREFYEEGDFRAALVEFQRAHELAPSYRLLYNIAQVQYQLLDYAGALRSFQQYLRDGQADIPPQRRDEVQREVERLRSRVATLDIVTQPVGAEVSVDDQPVGRTPLSEPVVVSAGRRKVTAELPGEPPVTRMVDVAGMDSVQVRLEFAPPPAPKTAAVQEPLTVAPVAGTPGVTARAEPRGVPWKMWAATGALAVGAGVTAVLASSAASDLKTQRDTFGVTRAQLDDASSKTKTLALTSDILTGATLVAAGISAFMTFSGGSSSDTPAPSSPSVRVGVGPGSVGLAGAF